MAVRFDVAVVGRGLIGAAAARHLAEAGASTAVIGPDEPAERRSSPGPFNSHPDEGRITRVADASPVWAEVAARSIARYGDIEARSGIDFHVPAGLVCAVPDAGVWRDNAVRFGASAQVRTADWLEERTAIHVANGHPIVHEPGPAGYVNPRRLVAAQTALCGLGGATVVKEAATAVRRDTGGFEVVVPSGPITAGRVLLTTGAFGAELLDGALDVTRYQRTTVTAEIPDDGRLPCLILSSPPDARLLRIYWVPPVRYRDGRVALKIGGELAEPHVLEPPDLVDWFHGDGDDDEAGALKATLTALLPGVPVRSWVQRPCVYTETPTGLPYVGWVEDGLAVAIGGNGAAAKSSDEWGRLAAGLFAADGWTDSLPASLFAPRMR